jgi:DNA-directed RNA polymerase sigma subunit (sigma70/sigma32)
MNERPKIIRRESDRNKKMYNYRMGYTDCQTHTLQETADKFGVTPARVQFICKRIFFKKKALEKLEKSLRVKSIIK